MNFSKRLIAFLLVISLLICFAALPFLQAEAQAVAIPMAGIDIFIAIVIALVTAAGIKLTCDNMDRASLRTAFGDKFNLWQQHRVDTGVQTEIVGIDPFAMQFLQNKYSNNGNTPGGGGFGKLLLGAAAYQLITDFIQWLTQSQGASDGTATDFRGDLYDTSMSYYGDIPVFEYPFSFQINSSGGYCAITCYSSTAKLYITKPVDSDFVVWGTLGGDNANIRQYRVNGSVSGQGPFRLDRHYNGVGYALNRMYIDYNYYYDNGLHDDWRKCMSDLTLDDTLIYISEHTDMSITDVGSSIKMSPFAGIDRLIYPQVSDGQQVGIDTSVQWQPDMDVSELLDGIISQQLENRVSARYDGVQQEVQPDTSVDSPELQSPGLTRVFPFSIPFTLYRLVVALKAPPEAPRIEWYFEFVDYTVVLDFSIFDNVARLLRVLELGLFIVALGVGTKKLIDW